jgi:hypothetical protein
VFATKIIHNALIGLQSAVTFLLWYRCRFILQPPRPAPSPDRNPHDPEGRVAVVGCSWSAGFNQGLVMANRHGGHGAGGFGWF